MNECCITNWMLLYINVYMNECQHIKLNITVYECEHGLMSARLTQTGSTRFLLNNFGSTKSINPLVSVPKMPLSLSSASWNNLVNQWVLRLPFLCLWKLTGDMMSRIPLVTWWCIMGNLKKKGFSPEGQWNHTKSTESYPAR
jgi:hypothetical protein